jgi:hypothetical protein
MAALIKGKRKTELGPVLLLGVELQDAREEIFIRMVCDGLSLGVAYTRAGFTSKFRNAPSQLFHLPRIQQRAAAILEARRTTGVVTLGQVTDMLQRVYAGAHAAEEYSAAHNAAFSLARLYGHVTDRATVEVIRRPSRDPDAPSEQALSSWVEALPGQGPDGSGPAGEASFLRVSDAPAVPLSLQAPSQTQSPNDINDLQATGPASHVAEAAGPGPSGPELPNEINWLEGLEARGRPENGAPTRPVTGTPNSGALSGPLGRGPSPLLGKTGPLPEQTGTVYPPAEDLF